MTEGKLARLKVVLHHRDLVPDRPSRMRDRFRPLAGLPGLPARPSRVGTCAGRFEPREDIEMVDPGPYLGEYPARGRQRHQVPGDRHEQLVGPPCLHDGPLFAGCRAGHRGVGLAFSQGRDAELGSRLSLRRSRRCKAMQARLVTTKVTAGRTKNPARNAQTRSSTGMLRWNAMTSSLPASWRSAAMATMAAPIAVLGGMLRGRSSTW